MSSAISARTSVILASIVLVGLSFSPLAVSGQTQSTDGQAAGSSEQGMQGQGTMENVEPMPGASYMRRPELDPVKGRALFVSKGCVACHSINHVGGHVAPELDAGIVGPMTNPFDVAALMWRKSPLMIAKQEEELGEQIYFTGDELSDIIAFIYDSGEQKKLTDADLTPEARKMLEKVNN
jgi:mono/diheme cytochrome c family protein